MRTYDGSDTVGVAEREGKVVEIMNHLKQLEKVSEEIEVKLNSFSEGLFGFVHDTKREERVMESDNCGIIMYRVANISDILNDMSTELNVMLNELPQKTEQ